jgi:hypothetical protein
MCANSDCLNTGVHPKGGGQLSCQLRVQIEIGGIGLEDRLRAVETFTKPHQSQRDPVFRLQERTCCVTPFILELPMCVSRSQGRPQAARGRQENPSALPSGPDPVKPSVCSK